MRDAFPCGGWLFIAVVHDNESEPAHIRLKHQNNHVPYCFTDIPKDIKKYITDNMDRSPCQVFTCNVFFTTVKINDYFSYGPILRRRYRRLLSLENWLTTCGMHIIARVESFLGAMGMGLNIQNLLNE
ncbi:hypothetical protein CPC08DRAFT_395871 [Agrocybe pediades]|nr:hypothetical protein CPC08DRAFT_395871 [Agrocybe pediades]